MNNGYGGAAGAGGGTGAGGTAPGPTEEATELQGRQGRTERLRLLAMAQQGLPAGTGARGREERRGQAALGYGAAAGGAYGAAGGQGGGYGSAGGTAVPDGLVQGVLLLRPAAGVQRGTAAAKGMGTGLAMGTGLQGRLPTGQQGGRPPTGAAVLVLAPQVALGATPLARVSRGPPAPGTPGTPMLMAAAPGGKIPSPSGFSGPSYV